MNGFCQMMKMAAAISTLAPSLCSRTVPLQAIGRADLNVTDGAVMSSHGRLLVDVPEMRAALRMPGTQRVELRFTYLGPTEQVSKLADGEVRRQLGLKLRGQDPCNLVYAMWRLAPKPDLIVSRKRNRGMRSSSQCRDGGYLTLKPQKWSPVPEVRPGSSHVLRAEIMEQELRIRVDDEPVWQGTLPSEPPPFDGYAGIRSDNVRLEFDILVQR